MEYTEEKIGDENALPLEMQQDGYVRTILHKGYDSYNWSKQKALESKVLKPRLEPSLNFIENKLSAVNDKYPVGKVVDALDSRIDTTIKYSTDTINGVVQKPVQLKNGTLMVIHKNLDKLKTEGEKTDSETKEVEEKEADGTTFKVIFTDVQQITNEKAAKVLDVSETLVNKYLPEAEKEMKEEDDESLAVVKENAAYRAITLSKVVTKRMQRRALSRLNELKLRTKQVAHVDLVKYSDMLDMDSKKVWFNETKEGVKSRVGKNVVQPMKKVGDKIGHGYGDLREKAKKYQEIAQNRIVKVKLPFSDKVVGLWTYVSTTADQKVVKPAEQILETFKQELHKQQEIVKKQEDDPNKPLTIEAGLRAVFAAARFRFTKEWESRVEPTVEKVKEKLPLFGKAKKEESPKEDPTFKVGGDDDDDSGESQSSTEPYYAAQD